MYVKFDVLCTCSKRVVKFAKIFLTMCDVVLQYVE